MVGQASIRGIPTQTADTASNSLEVVAMEKRLRGGDSRGISRQAPLRIGQHKKKGDADKDTAKHINIR